MTGEQTYLENLQTIKRIARSVAHKNRLNPTEADEFVQEVCVRLLDDDYAILRKFEDRSSLSTYLTTVIIRLYQQWRVEQWGKWRPSAEARRLGEKAITLERLMTRDGFSFGEAVRVLTTPGGSQYTAEELEAIYLRLPLRTPRPMPVSDDALPEAIAADAQADERVQARDREHAARHTTSAIDGLLRDLEPEDRLILQMRFWHARKVPDIARILHIEQKKIYKRLDKLFGTLRRGLERAGVSQSDVAGLLTSGDQEMHFSLLASENSSTGPSNSSGGEGARGGEGRLR